MSQSLLEALNLLYYETKIANRKKGIVIGRRLRR